MPHCDYQQFVKHPMHPRQISVNNNNKDIKTYKLFSCRLVSKVATEQCLQ